jgi:enoyl-CoA hydratase/carnithine racemase
MLVLQEIDDVGVCTLTLNRPERLNAWTPEMGRVMEHLLREADADPAVRVVVITGAGRAFCAGLDMSDRGVDVDPNSRAEYFPHMVRKPVIAAINGAAIGIGITFPLLCDIRVVAADAKLSFAFVRRGVISELGSHLTLPRLVGHGPAAELLLSGRVFLGEEAAALRLATAALPADQVLQHAIGLARDICVNVAPASAALTKRLLWQQALAPWREMVANERKLFDWVAQQPDAGEGVRAFVEKRAPRWSANALDQLPPLSGGK